MSSLKAFLPRMARTFGTTPDALYARQRALIRLGLLPTLEGKGPGSGVLLTADSVAVMIIAILSADTLAETDQRVVAMCDARDESIIRERGVPHHLTFRAAIAQIVTDGGMSEAASLISLHVSRCSTSEIKMVRTKGKGIGQHASRTYLAPEALRVPQSSPIGITASIEAKELVPLFYDFFAAAGLDPPIQRYP